MARRTAQHLAQPWSLVVLALGIVVGLAGTVAGWAIAAAALLQGATSAWMEARAERQVGALRARTRPVARLRRGGRPRLAGAEELVVGDIVDLQPGDRVPADLRLISCDGLTVDQGVLTGDPFPVQKQAGGPWGASATVRYRIGAVHAGTRVVAGTGVGQVIAIGRQTAFARASFRYAKPAPSRSATSLEPKARRLQAGLLVAGAGLAVAAHALAPATSLTTDALQLIVILTIVGLAWPTTLAPAALLAVAAAADRLRRRGIVVRDLPPVERLGAADTLVVDAGVARSAGEPTIVSWGAPRESGRLLWQAVLLCSHIPAGPEPDPLDIALVKQAKGLGHKLPKMERRSHHVDVAWQGAVHTGPQGHVLTVRGSPAAVLARCRPSPERDEAVRHSADLARQGLRVLAFAGARTDDLGAKGLLLLGLVSIQEPVRAATRRALADAEAAGLRVVLASAEAPESLRRTALALGLDTRGLLAAHQLDGLAADERAARLAAATLLADANPDVRAELARAIQSHGGTVLAAGDPEADQLLLAAAHVGVGVVGTQAPDVARAATGLTVGDGDLGLLVAAVQEGRRLDGTVRAGAALQGALAVAAMLVASFAVANAYVAGLFSPLPAALLVLLAVLAAGPLTVHLANSGCGRIRRAGYAIGTLLQGSLAGTAAIGTAWWATLAAGPTAALPQALATLALLGLVLAASARARRWCLDPSAWRGRWNVVLLLGVAAAVWALHVEGLAGFVGLADAPEAAGTVLLRAVLGAVAAGLLWDLGRTTSPGVRPARHATP